jgi:hypothetical protein
MLCKHEGGGSSPPSSTPQFQAYDQVSGAQDRLPPSGVPGGAFRLFGRIWEIIFSVHFQAVAFGKLTCWHRHDKEEISATMAPG